MFALSRFGLSRFGLSRFALSRFALPRLNAYTFPIMTLRPFHLAFPVDDLAAARSFYCGVLGCSEGRSASKWIDFNFHGHQITAHLAEQASQDAGANAVDSKSVPIPHFGIVLTMAAWEETAERLQAQELDFIIEPTVRFKGRPGEQATMFFRDPAGNALELKAMADDGQLFES
jgi:extradiol dioxygenase family protein